jgi:hypothetical protein
MPITIVGGVNELSNVVAVSLKTGALPSLILSNQQPELELLVNTTKK